MDNNNKRNRNNMPNRTAIIITLISAIFIWYMFSVLQNQIKENTNIEKTYDEFMTMMDNDEIEEVIIDGDRIIFIPKVQPYRYDISYYTGNLYAEELNSQLQEANARYGLKYSRKVVDNRNTILESILSMVLPFILIYVVMWFLFKAISKNSGGVMGFGKSNAKVYVEKSTGVTFKDVAGQEEAKESLTEIVDFLHNPTKYTRIGAKLPKGALLVDLREQVRRFLQKQ